MKHRFPQSRSRLLWLVAVGFFMQTLDATIVNTALPAMAADLQESPLRMQSVVVAYSVAMAMLIPASGWIADRIGMRRAFFSAIVVFVLGSVLCALSPTLDLLVASRVLQGFGGALLLPVGRLVILRTFPREEFLEAISFVAIPGLVGPLIGPTLGGWLVETASWHWIFLINVPVGLAGCMATLRFMPKVQGAAAGRFGRDHPPTPMRPNPPARDARGSGRRCPRAATWCRRSAAPRWVRALRAGRRGRRGSPE